MADGMAAPGKHKPLLLSLQLLLVPVLAFLLVSVRLALQERELRERRQAEEQQHQVARVSQELSALLQALTLEQISQLPEYRRAPRKPWQAPLELVGVVRDGRLVLPWPAPQPTGTASARWMAEGKRQEFAHSARTAACRAYRQALRAASQPQEEMPSRMAILRTCAPDETNLTALLNAAPDLVDERGVPWRLHALAHAAQQHPRPPDLLSRFTSLLYVRQWLPMEAADLARRVAGPVLPSEPWLSPSYDPRYDPRMIFLGALSRAKWGHELQLQWGTLFPPGTDQPLGQAPWLSFQNDWWLVSKTSYTPGSSLLLAVNREEALQRLPIVREGATVFLHRDLIGGSPLGDPFPRWRVLTTGLPSRRTGSIASASVMAGAGVLLVLSLAAFSAWLVYRDVRREVQLAEVGAQFVASVTHELRTPLTSIRLFADLLRLGRARTPEKQQHYLDTIVTESERLSRLVEDVLLFARLDRGGPAFRLASVSLPEVARSAVQALEQSLAQQGFTLDVALDETVPPVRGDRDALQQALLNLLTNAVKYSADRRQIALRLRCEENCAVLEVADQGIGIPFEEQRRIFGRFYRVPGESARAVPGAGIGLSLVDQIARAHQGEVRVVSQPGVGSTFSLRIPLEAA